MKDKNDIVANWLPRYTGTPLDGFGQHVLLTNFGHYVERFAEWHDVPVLGREKAMPNATADGITMINFGMGSPNAATVMDLLSAIAPKARCFSASAAGSSARTSSAIWCCRSRRSAARARRTTICCPKFPRCRRSSCSERCPR